MSGKRVVTIMQFNWKFGFQFNCWYVLGGMLVTAFVLCFFIDYLIGKKKK
ncbi:MAG: hypothetical protein HY290_20610 [Planctomycetia bacterium]|nr:hypothetical protein [Planctomycetia bacterium]